MKSKEERLFFVAVVLCVSAAIFGGYVKTNNSVAGYIFYLLFFGGVICYILAFLTAYKKSKH